MIYAQACDNIREVKIIKYRVEGEMRIENPRYTERFGSVKINEVQRVIELDSGRKRNYEKELLSVRRIDEERIRDIEEKMAIVLPIKNENTKLFEGVISAIPHDCLVIVVSNSQRMKIDKFKAERELLTHFCELTQREAFIVHQKDKGFAQALKEVGYTDILGNDGLVRDGKCEGMIIGILMAKLLNKDYVGFIDTDNFIPGSVWEYVANYAAGFNMASSPYSMVRILWKYKHHVDGEFRHFRKWGRVSSFSNQFVDALISNRTGFEPDIIKTACAGEHAMSLKLAELLPFASGYAVETYELVYILEKFGGSSPIAERSIRDRGIEIFQIETKNPHVHESRKDEEHLTKKVLLPSLSAIYHSSLCEPGVKKKILDTLLAQNCLKPNEEPSSPRIYPPIKTVDFNRFAEFIKPRLANYSAAKERKGSTSSL